MDTQEKAFVIASIDVRIKHEKQEAKKIRTKKK